MIWLDLPKSGKAVPPKKWAATMREYALWMRTAYSSGVPVVLCGWRGKQWQYEALAALLTDNIVSESRHTLCHYGMQHVDEECKAAFHMYSTFAVAQCRCTCKPPVAKTSVPAATIANKIYEKLLPKTLKQLRVMPILAWEPDSKSNYNIIEKNEMKKQNRKQLRISRKKPRIPDGGKRKGKATPQRRPQAQGAEDSGGGTL